MKYLCLIYLDEANWSACPDRDCLEFANELAGSGRLLAAEPLHPAHSATTVRVRNGNAHSSTVLSPRRRSCWPASI